MAVRPQPHLFTVEEYYRMAQTGILGEDDRVELIKGEVVEMTPISSRHAATVDRLTALFSRLVIDLAVVRVQGPIRLGQHSEPQPDVTLLCLRRDFYAEAHPGPEDALLVVEVAESSAAYDRSIKASLYSVAGVPELWIVDLARAQIATYRSPGPDGYGELGQVVSGGRLSPLAFPDLVIDPRDVLGL